MPRGEHPNSRANLNPENGKNTRFKKNDARTVECARKSNAAQTQMKSIAEELKEMLSETDKEGNTCRKLMAAIALKNAKDNSKWFELMLKLAGEMPAEIQVINLNAPDSEDTEHMLKELKAHAKGRSRKNTN